MKRICLIASALLAAAGTARGGLVCQRWGGTGKNLTHPGTMKVISSGKVPRLLFDLSGLPQNARVYHASLVLSAGQPREPIQVFVTASLDAKGQPVPAGGALKLEPPWYRSLDATEAAKAWATKPAGNLGFAMASFPGALHKSCLEVRYEGQAAKLPPQVEGLKVIHGNGQTALIWKELPEFRPPAKEIVWIEDVPKVLAEDAGNDQHGNPRPAAVLLKTLRDLQGLAVRDKPIGDGSQRMPPMKRLREVPEVRYRVYRSTNRITAETIKDAELIGESKALDIYQSGFVWVHSWGEYRDKWEDPKSVIPTFCVGKDFNAVLPGESYYVHTPKTGGKGYYAVTAVRDGTENASLFGEGNSLSRPVVETSAPPVPVRQFVRHARSRYGNAKTVHHWFAYWAAPPFANLPQQRPRRIVMGISEKWTEPGPLVISSGGGGPGWKVDNVASAYLYMERGGGLGYSQGRGTLRSHRQTKVDYYQDRYVTEIVNWALGKWKIDRAKIVSNLGMHYTMRHVEVFRVKTTGPYEINFDTKWNPASGTLYGQLGPPDMATTVDGHRAWDLFDVYWYLRQDPGRDAPFFLDCAGIPKDSGHGAEYGWQDDPKGFAAFREARQPYVGQWGGARVSAEVRSGLSGLRWDRSVPAFSNCTLDNNPGNGDPDDGDPMGQINGFLFWDYDTIADEKDRWEMTVYLVASCYDQTCQVDLTPRHCGKFKPKAGRKFKWTNTSVADGKVLASGTVTADKWALTTLRQITVTKGKNRITIAAE